MPHFSQVIQRLKPSLPIYETLFSRLKQRGQVADMNTIIEAVNQDWATLVNRIKHQFNQGQSADLRDNVHSALGALIKQRKVYYTGNKGYFLVGPSDASSNANGCTPGLFNSNGGSNGANKLTTVSSLGSKFSHLRHSMRERSSSSNGSHNSPGTFSKNQNAIIVNLSLNSTLSS